MAHPHRWYPLAVLSVAVLLVSWNIISLTPELAIHAGTRGLGLVVLNGLLFLLGIAGTVLRIRRGLFDVLSFIAFLAPVGNVLAWMADFPEDVMIFYLQMLVVFAACGDAMRTSS